VVLVQMKGLGSAFQALYVFIDDHIVVARRRRVGRPPRLSDSELVCIAVAQVLLGFPNNTAGCGSPSPARSPVPLSAATERLSQTRRCCGDPAQPSHRRAGPADTVRP
jgi:hypothetical protein